MNQDDLSDAISAASVHVEQKQHSEELQTKVKSAPPASRWIGLGVLITILFWSVTHFDRELALLGLSINPSEINNSTNELLDQAAQTVEDYYLETGELPDQLPDSYLSNVIQYEKVDDQSYDLMFSFNGVVSRNNYRTSYRLAE